MSILYDARVVGVSVALPKERVNLAEAYPNSERIMQLTGIRQVCVAPQDRTAGDYCIDAAEKLIAELDFDRNLIDGIVFVSPQPDYIFPGTAGVIQRRLNLRKDLVAFDINHGCTGFIYGLFQASMLVQCGTCKNVLMCCGNTSVRFVNEADKSLRMLMGDGSASAIITKTEEKNPTAFSFCTNGYELECFYVPAGGCRQPIQPGLTDIPCVDDSQNVRTLENMCMDGVKVMKFDLDNSGAIIESVLAQRNIFKNDVGFFFFNQSNEFVVKRLIKKNRLDPTKVPICVRNTGNVGVASVPLTMCNTFNSGNVDFSNVLLCALGVGLSGAAMLTNFSNTYVSEVLYV